MARHILIHRLAALFLIFVIIRISQADNKPSFFGKPYKLDRSENLDEFLEAFDVGWIMRKIATLVRLSVTLTKDDKSDIYTLTTKSTFKDMVTHFKMGEEFDDKTADERDVRTIITLKDNILTMVSKDPISGRILTVVREYGDKEMKAIMTVDKIVCTVYFKLEE